MDRRMDVQGSNNWTLHVNDSQAPTVVASTMVSLLLLVLETMMATAANSFIISSIFMRLLKKQGISTRDKILCALSFSNLLFPIVMCISIMTRILFITLDVYMDVLMTSLVMDAAMSCSWLTFCLCLFYLVKIVPSQCRCLSVLKMKADVIISWVILVVELGCLCSSILQTSLIVYNLQFSSSTILMRHYLLARRLFHATFLNTLTSNLIVIIMSSATVTSLHLHIHQMTLSLGTADCAQIRSYRGVVRTLKHLLAIYIFFSLDMTIYHLVDFSNLPFVGDMVIISFLLFSPLQGFIIIRGDPKLRAEWNNMWTLCLHH